MSKPPKDAPVERQLGLRRLDLDNREVVFGSQQPHGQRSQQQVAPSTPSRQELQSKPDVKD